MAPPSVVAQRQQSGKWVGGQVLVEFALGTVGLVVLALVSARVAYWLNESMVARNQAYQDTRKEAGELESYDEQGTVVPFQAPPALAAMIGGSAGSTPAQPSQEPGKSAKPRRCDEDPAVEQTLDDINVTRTDVLTELKRIGSSSVVYEKREEAIEKLNEAAKLIEDANTIYELEEQKKHCTGPGAAACIKAINDAIDDVCDHTVPHAGCPSHSAMKRSADTRASNAKDLMLDVRNRAIGLQTMLQQLDGWQRDVLVKCSDG